MQDLHVFSVNWHLLRREHVLKAKDDDHRHYTLWVPEVALSPNLNLDGKELSERCKTLGVVQFKNEWRAEGRSGEKQRRSQARNSAFDTGFEGQAAKNQERQIYGILTA